MKARWDRLVDQLRTGFWFAPMVMLLLACGMALFLLYIDERVDPGIKASLPWAYSGGPEGARSLLSTIAGSMITAASVTFSLASVALSLASQQYGSRVLRNFMRDRITQVLLGTFVSTFIYSVLVVRAIRGTDVSGGFVPAISITVAIALSLASLILLIYFIHHISSAIQASKIVQVIAEDLGAAIPRLYPSQTGKPLEKHADDLIRTKQGEMTVAISKSGYLQAMDLDSLMEIATKGDLVIALQVRPGDHLVKGDEVAQIFGTDELDEEAMESLLETFILGGERTPTQDIRYQFQQLTDVIVRALSPGINDPFTALNGIDELATGISLLAAHTRVVEERQDNQGNLRLRLPATSVGEVMEGTVGHIAIYGAGDKFVVAALRKVIDIVERSVHDSGETAVIERVRRDLDWREKAKLPT